MTAQSTGGPAKRVRVIADSDLKQNGGGYVLEGKIPLAVYGVSEGETVAQGGQYPVEGNIPAAVYIVEAPDGVVTGNVPVPMIAVEGGLVAGNTAIPVYVVGGSLGGLDPVTNLALAIGNAPANDEIDILWDAVSGATGYEIEYSDDGVGWTPVDTTASTSYALTSTDFDIDAVTHYVRVRAVNGSSESDWEQVALGGVWLNITNYHNLNDTNWLDSVGSDDYTPSGSPTNATGKIGNGVNLNGGVDQLAISGGNYGFTITPFTIGLWVQLNNDPLSGFYRLARMGASSNFVWQLYNGQAGGGFSLEWYDSSDVYDADTLDASPSEGEWYYLVIGYDGANLAYSLNGAATVTMTAAPKDPTGFTLFHSGVLGGTQTHVIDEDWLMLGRFPSAAQISYLYNSGNGRAYLG